jgi:hypothetical protein
LERRSVLRISLDPVLVSVMSVGLYLLPDSLLIFSPSTIQRLEH